MEVTIYGDNVYIKEQKWYRRIKGSDEIEDEIGEINSVSLTTLPTTTTTTTPTTKKGLGLYDEHPKDEMLGKFLVHLECVNKKDKKKLRLFTVFDSYLEFASYASNFPGEYRCFFETIIGEFPQKPHFDIDISDSTSSINPDEVKDALIAALIEVMKEIGIDLDLSTDILIYTSHSKNTSQIQLQPSQTQVQPLQLQLQFLQAQTQQPQFLSLPETKKKHSFHIIVNNYCCINHNECREIYNRCIKKMDPKFAQFIDSAVYSSLQQFRILGSRKMGTERTKTFLNIWSFRNQIISHNYTENFENERHKEILELDASLITVTSSCQYIPTLVPEEEKQRIRNKNTNYEEIDINIARKAFELLANHAGMSSSDRKFPFRLTGIKDSLVLLKRIKASYCTLCSRIHSSENGYMVVVGEEQNVYYNCRRCNPNKKLFLGKINPLEQKGLIENSTTSSTTDSIDPQNNEVTLSGQGITITVNINEMMNLAKSNYKENKKKPPTSKDFTNAQLQFIQDAVKSTSWSSRIEKE